MAQRAMSVHLPGGGDWQVTTLPPWGSGCVGPIYLQGTHFSSLKCLNCPAPSFMVGPRSSVCFLGFHFLFWFV